MTTYTISGVGSLPDDTTPLRGTWTISIYTDSGIAFDPDTSWRGGKQSWDTAADGSLSIVLPATDGSFLYLAHFESKDKKFRIDPTTFDLSANRTWKQIIATPTLAPVTPSQVTQAQTAATAAATSAAAAAASALLIGSAEQGYGKVIHVNEAGNDADSGLTESAAKLTIAAALTAMGANVKGTIFLGPGDIDAGTGVVWGTTYRCGIVGRGIQATRIHTTGAQSGPVLDFSGVQYNMDGVEIGGFTINGDNTAGATKKGLVLSSVYSNTTSNVHDIAVRYTGGACFDLGNQEVGFAKRLVAYTPVNAATSNIPYVMATGDYNGNELDVLLIGTNAAGVASCGASGAVVIKDNGTHSPGLNNITVRAENVYVPANGTLVSLAGTENRIEVVQFDCSRVSGAAGTSYLRLDVPTVEDGGGNQVIGLINGAGGSTATEIATGVDVRQSRNAVIGVKGYRGGNVTLASGVANTTVVLFGAQSGADQPAVIDNSGQTTNTIIDNYLRLEQRGPWLMDDQASGPRIYSKATPANGSIALGTSGSKWTAAGAGMFGTTDSLEFKRLDGVSMGFIDKFAGWKLVGPVELTAATTTTAPSAGAGGALPATPAGYVTVTIGGAARKIPYY